MNESEHRFFAGIGLLLLTALVVGSCAISLDLQGIRASVNEMNQRQQMEATK